MESTPQRRIFVPSRRRANPLANGLRIAFDPAVPEIEPPGFGTVIADLANLNEEDCCQLYQDGLEPVIFLEIVVRMATPRGEERLVKISPTWGASHFKGQLGHKIARKYVEFWLDSGYNEALLEYVFLLQLRGLDDGTWEAVIGSSPTLQWA